MRILIVSSTAGDRLSELGDAGATVIGVADEVAQAEIVITEDGRLLKSNMGTQTVEVRVV